MAKAKKTIKDVLVSIEEMPYEVPENWSWIHLLDSFDNVTDSKKKVPTKEYQEEGKFPIVDQGQSFVGGFTNREDMIYDGKLPVVIFGDHTRCVKYVDFPFVQGADGVKVLRPKKFWYSKAFYYALKSVEIPNMGYRRHYPLFKNFCIPVPPVPEQKRIVEQIESLFSKLDEAKEKAQEVIDGFDSRRAAILTQAFSGKLTEKWREETHCYRNNYLQEIEQLAAKTGRKNTKKVQNDFADDIATIIPNSWASTDLERIARKITDGEHKTPKRVSEYCGYYLLSARNVRNGAISLEDVDYVDKDEYEKISKRCNPTEGDVLISCSGSVGRVCVVEDNNKYCMVRSAAVISLLAGVPRFVMYMLQSNYVQEQIKALTKQTAQANLFLGAISALVIPFPSKEEQEKIVEILDRILLAMEEAKEIAEKTIEEIDLIKKSILTKAFRGELETNDSSDEPAEELLKRILAEVPVEEKKKLTTRKTKVKVAMNKDMLEAVREAGKITPERLKEETGLGIDEFYEELKRLTESGQVSEKREGGDVYLEVRDAN